MPQDENNATKCLSFLDGRPLAFSKRLFSTEILEQQHDRITLLRLCQLTDASSTDQRLCVQLSIFSHCVLGDNVQFSCLAGDEAKKFEQFKQAIHQSHSQSPTHE